MAGIYHLPLLSAPGFRRWATGPLKPTKWSLYLSTRMGQDQNKLTIHRAQPEAPDEKHHR